MHVEPWKWPNPVRKVWLRRTKDLGWKAAGLKLCTNKDFSLPNLHWNLPFLLWFVLTKSIHVRDAFIGWLHICFTCERCSMTSWIKETSRVLWNFNMNFFTLSMTWSNSIDGTWTEYGLLGSLVCSCSKCFHCNLRFTSYICAMR